MTQHQCRCRRPFWRFSVGKHTILYLSIYTDSNSDGKDNATEPFPAFDALNDPYDERNIRRALGVQIDKSHSSARTWTNRHGDVRARPQTTRFDPAAADNAMPPTPPRKDPNYIPSPPSSLSKPETTSSPAGVPLPTSPDTPVHSYRREAHPGSPYNISTSSMSTPHHQQTSPLARYRPSPRGPAPPTPQSASRLPQPPYGGHLPRMMMHTNVSTPHLPPRTSSRLPPPGFYAFEGPPPTMNMPTANVATRPGMSPTTQPRRQRCSSDTHSFSPIDARNVTLPGRNNPPSPYQKYPSAIHQRWRGPHYCESCGDVEERYMRCQVEACGLVLCSDCARMMNRFAEARREAREKK